MKKTRAIPPILILSAVLLLATLMACTLTSGERSLAPSPDEPADDTLAEPTSSEPALESMLTVRVVAFENEIVYDQSQRSAQGMNVWPDGNIGIVPNGDQFTFFAANGPRTARTVGTLDDPAAKVEINNYLIEGDFSEYGYIAGGPVYRDPETGLLLLFYHAEIHFGGPPQLFQSVIGLARSSDEGRTFQDLGLIVENNTPPNETFNCCADVGGGSFAIKDGQFFLYFRDRLISGYDIQLALAVAPVEEVLAAAQNGMVSEWQKYNNGQFEPGLGGVSSALEIGNPWGGWYSVMYSTVLDRFVLVSSTYETVTNFSMMYLTTSADGIVWSPRVMLREFEGFIDYPTMVAIDGNTQDMDDTFYIYYNTTAAGKDERWSNTLMERATVTLGSEMVPPVTEWHFDEDAEGWRPLWNISIFEVIDGALVVDGLNNDPYLSSPTLGLSTDEYSTIEISLKTDVGGDAQFTFTSSAVPEIRGDAHKFFPVQASADFQTYQVDMSNVPGWEGLLGYLRFDPVGSATRTEIDYVRMLP